MGLPPCQARAGPAGRRHLHGVGREEVQEVHVLLDIVNDQDSVGVRRRGCAVGRSQGMDELMFAQQGGITTKAGCLLILSLC